MKTEEQLVLLNWGVASMHYAPCIKEQVLDIARSFLDESFRDQAITMLSSLPPADDADDSCSLQAAGNGLIEFFYQVDTQGEFDQLAEVEYELFRRYCELNDEPLLPKADHLKDMATAIARDYLVDRAKEFGQGMEGMTGVIYKAAVSEEISRMIPEIAELIISGEFLKQKYKYRKFAFDGKKVTLLAPQTEENTKTQEDEWPDELV